MTFLKNILKRRRTADCVASGAKPKEEIFDPSADCPATFSNMTDIRLAGYPRPTGFYAAYYAEPVTSQANVGFYTVPAAPTAPTVPTEETNPSPKTRRARRRACLLFDNNGVPINTLEGSDVDCIAQVPFPPSSAGSQYSIESGEPSSHLPVGLTPKVPMTVTRPWYGRSMSLDQGDKLIRAPSYRRRPNKCTSAEGSCESGAQTSTAASDGPFAGFTSSGKNSYGLGGDMEYIPLHQTLDQPLIDDLTSPADETADIGADMGYVPLRKTMAMTPSAARSRYR